MTEEHTKEQLSVAYAQAISAYAGLSFQEYSSDYGLDARINDIQYSSDRKRYWQTGFGIDIQLKATINAKIKSGIIIYDLEVKNYKDLIQLNIGTPRILILFVLPKNRNDWVQVSCNEMKLEKCAYWCSLKGLPDTKNGQKVRIKIPETQVLTAEELVRLMDMVKRGVL